jgi:fucose permease
MDNQEKKISISSLFSLVLVAGMILIAPGPILDSLMKRYELTKSIAGRIPFLFFLGQFLGLFFLSELARIFGVKRLLLVSLGLSAILLLLISFTPGLYMVLAAFGVLGFADAILWSFPGVITTRASGANVNRDMNYLYAFFAIGVTAEPLLAGWIINCGYGFRGVLIVLACLAVVVIAWISLRTLPDLRNIQKLTLPGLQGMIKSRRSLFLLLCIGLFCYIASEQGLSVWIPKFMIDRFPGNAPLAGLTLSGIWLCLTAGRFFFGWVSKWIDRSALLFVLTLASLAASSAAAIAPNAHAVMILYLIYGLSMSGIFPLLLAFCEGFQEQYLSMAFGMILAVGYLGGALGALPVGMIAEKIKFSIAMLYPAGLILFLLAIIPFLPKASHKGTNQDKVPR